MKIRISILLFGLIFLTSFQDKQNGCIIRKATITGRIVGDGIFDNVSITNDFLNEKPTSLKVKPDQLGNFKINIDLITDLELALSYDRTFTWIKVRPGDSIFLIINKKKKPEIVFTGDNSEFLNQYYNLNQRLNLSPEDPTIHYREDSPDQYLNFASKKFNNVVKSIDRLCAENNYPANLKESFESTFRVDYGMDLLLFLNYARMMQNLKINKSTLSHRYINTVDSLFKISKNDYGTRNYHNLLILYSNIFDFEISDSLTRVAKKRDIILSSKIQMDYYLQNFHGIQKDYLVSFCLSGLMERGYLSDQVFDKYSKTVSCLYFSNILNNKFSKYKNLQDKNFDRTKIHLADISQDDNISILETLKKNHNGRLLYVDIWATWCGPCIANFSYASQLRKALSIYPIDYIYLATSSDKNAWDKIIYNNKIEGFHYFLNKKQEKEIRDLIEFSSIPHYSIFSPSCKLLIKDAKAPYDPDLLKDIKEIESH